MVKSMTGFGRANGYIATNEIAIELKSVNHRFFELNCRLPRAYHFMEEKIKSYLQTVISRGKIDLTLTIVSQNDAEKSVCMNETLVDSYISILHESCEKFQIANDISISNIMRLPDVFVFKSKSIDEEMVSAEILSVLQNATQNLVVMRRAEGEHLKQNLTNTLAIINENITNIHLLWPATIDNYQAKLHAKVTQLLGNTAIDESRILTEVAIFAEKVAIDEELTRLHSHVEQFACILTATNPIGRQLDFLVQEINREVNTIGSKANDVHITKLVIVLKSELEKIREQIQNIE